MGQIGACLCICPIPETANHKQAEGGSNHSTSSMKVVFMKTTINNTTTVVQPHSEREIERQREIEREGKRDK